MEQVRDTEAALAALAWLAELGADEAVGDTPVDRYAEALTERPPAVLRPVRPATAAAPPAAPAVADPRQRAAEAAARAGSLAALRGELAAFDGCEARRGARNLVFADGTPGARVMILTDPPGRDDDVEGRHLAGQAGLLLDRMFAAIGLARTADDPRQTLYLAPIMPWRLLPQDRDPTADELAMMRPFAERHISLAAPDILVAMGSAPLALLLGLQGISRMRGTWHEALGRPVLAMCHPAYLLRNPASKHDAWADLLALQARLRSLP